MDVQFETMAEEYAKDVIDIFNYYVENSFAAFPENKIPYEAFAMFQKMTNGYPAYVLKNSESEKVIGFCFLKPHNSLSVFHETAEITYFIASDAVGNGIGKKALARLEDDGRKIGIKNMVACVSSRNERSLAFHRKNGFVDCGRIKNAAKKNGQVFDEVWLQKIIG
jgi:phosphinothricin acetyltransferase